MNSIRKDRFKATFPVVGFTVVFMVLRVLFDYLGPAFASLMALTGAGTAFVLWHWSRSWNTRGKARKAIALRQQLSALEQQETDLRIDEARRAGKFDTWEARS